MAFFLTLFGFSFFRRFFCELKTTGIVFILVVFFKECGMKDLWISQKAEIFQIAKSVSQMDVGQGDGALVDEGQGHFGWVDVGSERALKLAAWIQLLAQRGVRSIDWVFLTHLDEDHVGALKPLATLFPIRCVVSSRLQWASHRGGEWRQRLAQLGIRTSENCIPHPIYLPEDFSAPRQKSKRNEAMGAILVPFQKNAHDYGLYLSAGDADAKDELPIAHWVESQIQKRGYDFRFRVLKVSHHGSRFSTSEEFLKMIKPNEAWISAGVGNRYGHPTHEILERLKKMKIPVYRTDLEGVISTYGFGLSQHSAAIGDEDVTRHP